MKNLKLPDLKKPVCGGSEGMFVLTASENTVSVIRSAALIGIISYFFYYSVIAVPFLIPFMFFRIKQIRREGEMRKREQFRMQFRDTVLSVSTNQRAGYSVENSFRESYKDMKLLYGSKSQICKELRKISSGLGSHVVLDDMLRDLGSRSEIDDIRQFAEVFSIARKSGGNMIQIIGFTAGMIDSRTEVEKDISLMLASRKYETKLMEGIPFLLIAYMKISNKGFFDVLYHNPMGIAVMTACLLVYLAACIVAEHIVSIQI